MVNFTVGRGMVLDKAFDALANHRRREIITYLALQPLSISRLANFQSMSLPAIHKHIKILESAELVFRQKVGRTNFLVLNSRNLILVQQWIMQHHTYWGNTKSSLENYVPNETSHLPYLTNNKDNGS